MRHLKWRVSLGLLGAAGSLGIGHSAHAADDLTPWRRPPGVNDYDFRYEFRGGSVHAADYVTTWRRPPGVNDHDFRVAASACKNNARSEGAGSKAANRMQDAQQAYEACVKDMGAKLIWREPK